MLSVVTIGCFFQHGPHRQLAAYPPASFRNRRLMEIFRIFAKRRQRSLLNKAPQRRCCSLPLIGYATCTIYPLCASLPRWRHLSESTNACDAPIRCLPQNVRGWRFPRFPRYIANDKIPRQRAGMPNQKRVRLKTSTTRRSVWQSVYLHRKPEYRVNFLQNSHHELCPGCSFDRGPAVVVVLKMFMVVTSAARSLWMNIIHFDLAELQVFG